MAFNICMQIIGSLTLSQKFPSNSISEEAKLKTHFESYMRIIFAAIREVYTFMCFIRSIKFSFCAWHSGVCLCKNETIEICCMATR